MRASLADGSLFAGRYRLIRRIATGGMGTVYEAEHAETGRRRAVKVMHPHLFRDPDMRERFQREARITAQIESEHIVDVSDAGVDDETGMPFLAMELLRGEDLASLLKRAGRMPPAEALVILRQAASALDRTHEHAVVHRDLKPENLFLTRREDGSPRVKILDFGVAKLVADGATGGATESLGTPLYMAPEQFRIGTKLTGAADVFALGMVAYALLAGEAYWRQEAKGANSSVAFALAAAAGPKEPPVQRAARAGVALPPAFDAWFQRATALDPDARFPSAGEAVRLLAEALGDAPSSAAVAPPASAADAGAPSGPVFTPASGTGESRTPPAPVFSVGSGTGEGRAPSGPVFTPASGTGESRASAPVFSAGSSTGESMAPPGSGLAVEAAVAGGADARDGAESAFERASTSTGAAMRSIAPERRRRPAVAAAIVVAVGAVAAGVWWLAFSEGPAGSGAAAATSGAPGGASAPGALEASPSQSVSTLSSAAPAPSAEPSSAADPSSSAGPSSAADPSSSAEPSAAAAGGGASASPSAAAAPAGTAPARPPVASPRPGGAPAATAPVKPLPLFGRD